MGKYGHSSPGDTLAPRAAKSKSSKVARMLDRSSLQPNKVQHNASHSGDARNDVSQALHAESQQADGADLQRSELEGETVEDFEHLVVREHSQDLNELECPVKAALPRSDDVPIPQPPIQSPDGHHTLPRPEPPAGDSSRGDMRLDRATKPDRVLKKGCIVRFSSAGPLDQGTSAIPQVEREGKVLEEGFEAEPQLTHLLPDPPLFDGGTVPADLMAEPDPLLLVVEKGNVEVFDDAEHARDRTVASVVEAEQKVSTAFRSSLATQCRADEDVVFHDNQVGHKAAQQVCSTASLALKSRSEDTRPAGEVSLTSARAAVLMRGRNSGIGSPSVIGVQRPKITALRDAPHQSSTPPSCITLINTVGNDMIDRLAPRAEPDSTRGRRLTTPMAGSIVDQENHEPCMASKDFQYKDGGQIGPVRSRDMPVSYANRKRALHRADDRSMVSRCHKKAKTARTTTSYPRHKNPILPRLHSIHASEHIATESIAMQTAQDLLHYIQGPHRSEQIDDDPDKTLVGHSDEPKSSDLGTDSNDSACSEGSFPATSQAEDSMSSRNSACTGEQEPLYVTHQKALLAALDAASRQMLDHLVSQEEATRAVVNDYEFHGCALVDGVVHNLTQRKQSWEVGIKHRGADLKRKLGQCVDVVGKMREQREKRSNNTAQEDSSELTGRLQALVRKYS